MKILVAEDSPTLLMTITLYIEQEGHAVLQAKNGKEALELYKKEAPDLVILDIMMPGMDGFESAKCIRAECGDDWIPIIFLSGMIRDEDIARGIEAGGDDYLTKPVSKIILTAKLKAMQRIAEMRNKLVQVSNELEQANNELYLKSYQDGLTEIYNRRYFDKNYSQKWLRARRDHTCLSALLIDIDYFKKFNDLNGHLAGDDCLKNVAQAINNSLLRPVDTAYRYGGEEFVVVLPDTNEIGALHVINRIRANVNKLGISYDSSDPSRVVSVSIGYASLIPEAVTTEKELLEQADKALYMAKQQGRDCAVCATQPDRVAAL
ncbi:MAG: diguanylate cyclase domain-containing protein [Gammaproteobacteria bacterium]